LNTYKISSAGRTHQKDWTSTVTLKKVDLRGDVDAEHYDEVNVAEIGDKTCTQNDDLMLNIWAHRYTKITNGLRDRETTYHVKHSLSGHVSIYIGVLDSLQTILLDWEARRTKMVVEPSKKDECTNYVLTVHDTSFSVEITTNKHAQNARLQFSDHFSTFLTDEQLVLRKYDDLDANTDELKELIMATRGIKTLGLIQDVRARHTIILQDSAPKNTTKTTLVVENDPGTNFIICNNESTTIVNLHIDWTESSSRFSLKPILIHPAGDDENNFVLINFRNIIHDHESAQLQPFRLKFGFANNATIVVSKLCDSCWPSCLETLVSEPT